MKISAKFTPGKKNANMIRALEQVSQAGNFTQGIGWFEDQLYPDGTKIVEVAKLQEYGGVNESGHRIPARPFMRPAKRRGRSEWRNDIKKGIKKGLESGNLDMENLLWKVGEKVKNAIVAMIDAVHFPKLSAMTIALRKARYKSSAKGAPVDGLDKPLIDSGIMISSIQNRKVEEEK